MVGKKNIEPYSWGEELIYNKVQLAQVFRNVSGTQLSYFSGILHPSVMDEL